MASKTEEALSAKSIVGLCLGGVSVLLGGIVGFILGVVAEGIALSALSDAPTGKTKKAAETSAALGVLGAVLSVINTFLFLTVAAVVIWTMAGGSLFGIPII